MHVSPKKYLGQHFLKDKGTALRIVEAFTEFSGGKVLEIGPGTGMLSRYLMEKYGRRLVMIEKDVESVRYLQNKYPEFKDQVLYGDFLATDLRPICEERIGIIGNFPYNISSQIFFKILEYKSCVQQVVGMVQKEVGDRICANPGSKTYGILSVLLSAYYDIEYLFTVEPDVFHPPPKVRSSVIRLTRNKTDQLACDPHFFTKIVKLGFQNRRKTLRNAIKALNLPDEIRGQDILGKRAEQLSVNDFVELTRKIDVNWKN